MVTKHDVTQVVGGIHYTTRTWRSNGMFIRGDFFVDGHRVGTYKTEDGLSRRVAKI